LRQLIQPWVGGIPDDDLKLVRVSEYTFHAQLADRWRDRNVFLLGDAAHLTPPFIGQGMGAGLRDAMNLVWKLAGVLSGDLPEEVLDSYQQERKPHASMMIALALGMGWAMSAGGRMGNLIRRACVPRLHYIPGIRPRLISSRTPGLRASSLVMKSARPGQLGGTLCPNPPLTGGQRLDSLLRNSFAFITSQPLEDDQQEGLRQRGATIVTVGPETELGQWLRRGRVAAAIVRPDRTVMQAGRRVNVLCEAMPHFAGTVVSRIP
jgi:3-(3-hydroxy-phenyl)propionate hydroxylase